MASKVLCNPKWSGVPFARLTRVKYLQNRLIFLWLLTSLVCVVVCWLCCHRTRGPLWTQVPLQPFHPDNKAARTGGLLNEISYQSTNSCGLCLAIRSGYESPSAALNSYYLDVYLLWGEKKNTCFVQSFTLWFSAAKAGQRATEGARLIHVLLICGSSHFIFTGGILS